MITALKCRCLKGELRNPIRGGALVGNRLMPKCHGQKGRGNDTFLSSSLRVLSLQNEDNNLYLLPRWLVKPQLISMREVLGDPCRGAAAGAAPMQHPLPTRCPWEGTQGWLPRGQSPRDGNAQGWK